MWWSVVEGLTVPQRHPSIPNAAVLIPGYLLRVEEFVLEGLKSVVVQVKLHLQCPISHTSATLEYGQRLVKDFLKGHRRPSGCVIVRRGQCGDGRGRLGACIPELAGQGKQKVQRILLTRA